MRDAENATRAKSAFLANTSHEIRTPLNAIIGLTHLMSNETLTNSQRVLIDKISLSGKSLLGIVNDVLDLSKIEANEMSLE
ncbi:histidine kinase dimerization/phospho-acceptor domain-containing protein, partial [Staphylococcus aureus]|uniref:histidine kinase dimerization/phospho-acceptor domain-containing protein n=1 Tax=Staphylococcus aureus TaxID=1280 RepID=UPI00301BDDBB